MAAWLDAFPELKQNRERAWQAATGQVKRMWVQQGSVLFRDGDACGGYVLVVDGVIRVQKIDPQGHEIVLYRVEAGQSCVLTTTCLLGRQCYPAEGIAESDVDMVLLPLDHFDAALAESPLFRRFVMANIGRRISDLMLLLEDVAFGRKDARLAALLVNATTADGDALMLTHRQLAVELGTAREVVSRLLKDFERRGLVRLGRNRIVVLQRGQIRKLTDRS